MLLVIIANTRNTGETRCWDDCRKFGFISAGQGAQWRDQILNFEVGDVIAAYLKGQDMSVSGGLHR
jgi:hypothetical protein